MKMKRIISALMIVCLAFAIASCGAKTEIDFDAAKWEGDSTYSVKELLEKGIPVILGDVDGSITATVTPSKGWEESDQLNKDSLSKGCEAVTYEAVATQGDKSMTIFFFMEYDKEKEVLVSKGGKSVSGENAEEVGAEEVDAVLNAVSQIAAQ